MFILSKYKTCMLTVSKDLKRRHNLLQIAQRYYIGWDASTA